MCDQTEVIYSPNDIVWVKLGPVWWPGRVCSEDEIPPEIMKDLRKTPIAIVKFFQEDSFEYVKSLSNIYHYHCPRKNEFIKKGLDMLRSKNRGAPSNMKLFPEDVVRAESLTNGNTAILQSDMFRPEEKPAYAELFASKKRPPKKLKSEAKKKPTPDSHNTPPPRLITHPRFLQLSSGQSTDYEVRERQQTPVRAECDQEDAAPPSSYSCVDCGYTTSRLNVMVWHNKSHTRNYASTPVSAKPTKRKSAPSTVKLKERFSSGGSPSLQPSADVEAVSGAKISKTNGQLKVARSPKTPGRKKGTSVAKKTPAHAQHTKETKLASSASRVPPQKGRRGSVPKGDEIHKSLLEDWLEDEVELEESAADDLDPVASENTALANGLATSGDSKGKSCFDFDDSEDHLVIDESKFTPGRKIPRLHNRNTPSTLATDDVVAIDDLVGNVEVEATSTNSAAKYQSGVEDSMVGESSLSRSTSQLQEMGVDNEIEIKTEDVQVDEVVIESRPPKKSRRILRAETKANDAAEVLHDQVDKLLNEITKAPTKLPEIPRSHKKVQLKAYQQQAEAEKQAAQKAAAEAELLQRAVAEAEATQKAAAKDEAAQVESKAASTAAVESEVSQTAAVETDASQEATIKLEAAQMVTDQKATTEEEDDEKKMLAIQQNVEKQEAYDLHSEMMNIDVSSIPLPSPQKSPVNSEPVESSISIGATVTVENETSDESWSNSSPVKGSNETLDAKNIATEASDADSGAVGPEVAAANTSSSHSPPTLNSGANVAKVSDKAIADNTNAPVMCSIPSKTAKPLNPSAVQQSGQPKLKFISQNEYKLLMNKLNASIGQVSPSKTSEQPLRAIKTTIKMTGGKSLVSNLGQPKVLLASSQTSGSPSKFLIVTNYKQASTAPATSTTTGTAATATSTSVARSISLANATTLRVTPNILQKSAAAQRAAAALAKSSGKNIVLDASTFQSLFHTQPQQLRKVQSQVALSMVAADTKLQVPSSTNIVAGSSQPGIVFVAEGSTHATSSNPECANTVSSSTSSSSSAGQTIDYNYIVDSSGNLVQVDEPPAVRTPTKDILAKALEDTDGLQTELALSEEVTNSVLDVSSVAQNTGMTKKTDPIYENVTLNTAPIMSAYETPSKAIASANLLAETASEMEIGCSDTDKSNTEYLT